MTVRVVEATTKPCMVCGRVSTLQVPAEGFIRWQNGDYIQTALPDLTVEEREMLMTGTHPDCWDTAFPDEED